MSIRVFYTDSHIPEETNEGESSLPNYGKQVHIRVDSLNSTPMDGLFPISFTVGCRVLSSSNERTKSDEQKFGVNRKGERAERWPKVIF